VSRGGVASPFGGRLCTPSRVPRSAGCCTRDRAEIDRILGTYSRFADCGELLPTTFAAHAGRRSWRSASRPGRQPTADTVRLRLRQSAEDEDERRDRGQDQRAKDGRDVLQVRTNRGLTLSSGPLAVPVAANVPALPSGSHRSNLTSHWTGSVRQAARWSERASLCLCGARECRTCRDKGASFRRECRGLPLTALLRRRPAGLRRAVLSDM
jgi:hypothetical protein